MTLSAVIEDLNENPHRERTFYEYPELYDFYHSRVLNRDAQIGLLERIGPDDANRVLEFGCGTGPLLTRIEDEYEEVLGVDSNDQMLAVAREKEANEQDTSQETDNSETNQEDEQQETTQESDQAESTDGSFSIRVDYDGEWSGAVGSEGSSRSVDGSGTEEIEIDGDPMVISANAQKQDDSSDELTIQILQDGEVVAEQSTTAEYGVASVSESFY